MKKIAALVFALTLVLTLVGCGEKTPVQNEALSGTIREATIFSSGQSITLMDSEDIQSLIDIIASITFRPAQKGEDIMAPGSVSVTVELTKEQETVQISFPMWQVGENAYCASTDSISLFNDFFDFGKE